MGIIYAAIVYALVAALGAGPVFKFMHAALFALDAGA